MICPPCKEAGQANADISEKLRRFRLLADWRDYLHKQCVGCDCQHKTGQWIIQRWESEREADKKTEDAGS